MPCAGNSPKKRRLDYLALGLDPAKAIFFRQSDVPEVCELAWIFGTVINMGLLERATSYKDKVEKGIEANAGLFTYPILMAADILIYRSHLVPVGQDQVQHVEMTRDIAEKFNRIYGEIFPLPNYRLECGRQGSRYRRPEDEQILRQYDRHLRRRQGAQKDGDERDCHRYSAGRSFERSGKKHDFRALQAVRNRRRSKMPWPSAIGPAAWDTATQKRCYWQKSTSFSAHSETSANNWPPICRYVEDVLREGAKKARAEAVQTMELVRTAVGFAGKPV